MQSVPSPLQGSIYYALGTGVPLRFTACLKSVAPMGLAGKLLLSVDTGSDACPLSDILQYRQQMFPNHIHGRNEETLVGRMDTAERGAEAYHVELGIFL